MSREGLYEEAVALADKVAAGEEFAAREKALRWLDTDTPADAKAAGIARTPLHWPLVFPEVFERGGFDAVIGNPPFLSGLKLSTSFGEAYRNVLVELLGRGVRGIREDVRYSKVLFPYLNGEDVVSRPDSSASRWVINFHNWPEEQAKAYGKCYAQVRDLVKPERQASKTKSRREKWWWFAEYRRSLIEATEGLSQVTVLTLVSKHVLPVIVPTGQVISSMLAVFASEDRAIMALLSSASHYWWAVTCASTLETRIRYTPSDVFETFPLPALTDEMRTLGDRLDTYRRSVMLARQTGLTKTYNLVFDPTIHDEDIAELRRIHEAIDRATVAAYGWTDLLDRLDHGFHPAGRDLRYTIGPWAQREILDHLLELNHERYAEEVAKGMHDKKKARTTRAPKKSDAEGLF